MIPDFIRAQETDAKESHALPSGFGMKIERTGGYLGSYSVFWIYLDGSVINGLGEAAKIPSDIVGQWLGTNTGHTGPQLAGTAVRPAIGSVCFDCFTYSISIYAKDGTRAGNYLFSAGQVEKAFPGILNRLQRLEWSPLMGEPEDPDPPRPVQKQPIKAGSEIQKPRRH